MKAVILAGGELAVNARLRRLAKAADLLVAADSGARFASELAVVPDFIVGDFDSVSPEVLSDLAGVQRVEYPERKNELDLELACGLALELGATGLSIMGAMGGRADQSLAALLIGLRLRREGVAVTLQDGRTDCLLLVAGDEIDNLAPPGTLFSLLALEEAVVTVSGAEYPLSEAGLPVGVGLGVSNRARESATARIHSGAVALFIQWDVPLA